MAEGGVEVYVHVDTSVQRSSVDKAWEYHNSLKQDNSDNGPPSVIEATPRRPKKRRCEEGNDENRDPNSQISDLGENSPFG